MTLHTQGLKTLAQVQTFVSSNEAISFTLTDRIAAYGWMTDTLKQPRRSGNIFSLPDILMCVNVGHKQLARPT
ncbi:hypothetical protein [Methylobacter sp.]|uniref:hypothetical protein n=1 Tax=Methylobacter sp. TaxID=2051955 RepID=UPI0011FBE3A9|nr:hypothetical protein [Methylobacter sp.]TAK59975.1 MAG: hypothetical protein EPO18_18680 [Methylobacter sp.]